MDGTQRIRVVSRSWLDNRMVRLTVAGCGLVGVRPRPAQDVEILLADGSGGRVKRRYSIRHARPADGAWDLDILVHDGGGPGSRWAQTAPLGSGVDVRGPRGKLVLRPGAHHVFVGDDASIPAIAALTEALPPHQSSTVIVQATLALDTVLPPMPGRTVQALEHHGHPTADPFVDPMMGAVTGQPDTHVYVLCESRVTAALRDLLATQRPRVDSVFAKGYWNWTRRGRA